MLRKIVMGLIKDVAKRSQTEKRSGKALVKQVSA
jgi:hypothetical protein